MQRTFITQQPQELASNQIVVDLPRYEIALARAFLRRDIQKADKFLNDDEPMNVVTTLNNIKTFADELALLDQEIDASARVPYTNYVGLQFSSVQQAVRWARSFVQKHFPATEERLLKRALLKIPLDKTEIVWIGGDRYLRFVQAIATSPSTDELVQAQTPAHGSVPQLTREEASKKRAEIAAKRGKKSDEAGENQPQA